MSDICWLLGGCLAAFGVAYVGSYLLGRRDK